MEEGCLSLPGLREEVKRPERIRLRYRDINFLEHEILPKEPQSGGATRDRPSGRGSFRGSPERRETEAAPRPP